MLYFTRMARMAGRQGIARAQILEAGCPSNGSDEIPDRASGTGVGDRGVLKRGWAMRQLSRLGGHSPLSTYERPACESICINSTTFEDRLTRCPTRWILSTAPAVRSDSLLRPDISVSRQKGQTATRRTSRMVTLTSASFIP